MESDFDVRALRAARRSYEWGRVRAALMRGALAAATVGVVAFAMVGARALPWVAATLATVALAEWRGGSLARGARRGVLAGAITLLLPLSILRPCCATGAPTEGDCCTMPQVCVVSGAIVGLALSLLLPRAAARRGEAAAGMALGAIAVAALRCGPLFLGETAGLLGGLVAGIAAAALADAALARRPAH